MLMDKEYPLEVLQFIDHMAGDDDIRELAKEPKLKMTQNSYSHYMITLTTLTKAGPTSDTQMNMHLWADVLIAAGGNEQGIRDALKVST